MKLRIGMFYSFIKPEACELTLAAIFAIGQTALSQSTIFNIPTTDAVSKGKIYLEMDYLAQIPKLGDLPDDGQASPRLQTFVPRGVAGLGANVEAGANVSVVHVGNLTNVFFQPNLKWNFLHNSKGLAASAGGVLYTPINNRKGASTFGLIYGNLSQKINHKYGPRITAGPYGVVGNSNGFAGPKAGVLAGYEQPVHAKISLVSDWFSGKNSFGYLTPGISMALPANGVFNLGYSIGNDSYHGNRTHNRLLFVYYGITF
jgi:hypothetical protein